MFMFLESPGLPMLDQITPVASLRKSDKTRAHLFQVALGLFRNKGFDAATMRDIAAEAHLALGAVYYYFPSKDAIVMDYYNSTILEYEQRVHAGLAQATNLRERLTLVMHTKLDLLREDRPLLQGLFRFAGTPNHPLSVFGPDTLEQREKTIAIFHAVVDQEEHLPEDVREVLPPVLWALHLAMILYFLHDDSPGQERTHRLAEGAMALLAQLVSLISTPLLQPILKPVRGRVLDLLREAKLLPADRPALGQEP
jgi:AcrR family transcriptional regulator